MIDQVIKFFIVFFVVVEPLSIAPVFVTLTTGYTPEFQRRMAFKSVSISALILLTFSLIGTPFLAAMGISIQAFRIFGGLLLFLIALEMVFARESGTRTSSDEEAESRRRLDISVFPLAFPLISGPGALVTILLWFGPLSITAHPLQFAAMAACVAVVLLLTLAVMLMAVPLMRTMGVTGTNVANRLFGVILGALAVQFVLDGIRASFQ
ncbi:MAG TPA: MarC family protein [Steroidobacteraceae bacterium]|jgi:multiple antibiotic resistance protein|nr:MarC family protein [Steroidobacteraceae bacterium]